MIHFAKRFGRRLVNKRPRPSTPSPNMDDPDGTPRSDARRIPLADAPPSEPEAASETSAAEVHISEGQVQVTLPMPTVAAEDLRYYVGSNLVLVWSSKEPETMRTLVHLPVDVAQHSSVVRFTNGVFDLTVLTAQSHPALQD